MQKVAIDIAVWQEDNAFVSQCLNVDVASYGDTVEDAVDNLKEALELYLEDTAKYEIIRIIATAGQNIPIPNLDTVKKKIHLDIGS